NRVLEAQSPRVAFTRELGFSLAMTSSKHRMNLREIQVVVGEFSFEDKVAQGKAVERKGATRFHVQENGLMFPMFRREALEVAGKIQGRGRTEDEGLHN